MQSNYTFLTDHSYSIRVDYDKLPLKQREIKTKKRRGTLNRSNKTTSTNRTVSIDRSSSDKENNSTINTSGNKRKSSMKKKTPGSRLSTNSRTQSSKKQNNKTPSKTSVKSTENSIIKKTKTIIKPLNSHLIDTKDAPLSLSIEERVKLRRTKPLLMFVKPVLNKKLQSNINHPIKKSVKRINISKSKKNIIKSKKLFLGSGLDLDNIVLGNRQRRSVQT